MAEQPRCAALATNSLHRRGCGRVNGDCIPPGHSACQRDVVRGSRQSHLGRDGAEEVGHRRVAAVEARLPDLSPQPPPGQAREVLDPRPEGRPRRTPAARVRPGGVYAGTRRAER